MTDKEKIEALKNCFQDVVWMAIRYAHGRSTYAPGMVRDAVRKFNRVFPEWKPKKDITIQPPEGQEIGGISIPSDYLDDLFEDI